MSKYDYLFVGAGLFGAVAAYRAARSGKKALVIDRRPHTGGNAYCEEREGIRVHKYGAHIFHTSNREVWEFVNRFVEFNNYINSPVANYKGKLYNLPFNMNTFYAMWGVTTPAQAAEMIDRQRREAGTFDNNYFNDRWQGIPIGGYNKLVDGLLAGVEVRCDTDFFADRTHWESLCDRIVFTGRIDEYYDCRLGELEYRSLRFEHETLDTPNYQGVAVMNFTEREIPYTRIIEHKHFEPGGDQPRTIITREYPAPYEHGAEPYYPVNAQRNTKLYESYKALADRDRKVIFGGRLGEYRYYDMDKVIESALKLTL